MIEVTDTGYFGIPGGEGGLVHAVVNAKPVCGQTLNPKSQFQWCCHGLHWQMLECEKCKKLLGWQLLWTRRSEHRWERRDGAVVVYDRRHWGPETDENSPDHRGWVAFAPGPQQTNYLGFFPPRRRKGGHSKMRVSIKFKTADAAILAIQKMFPWPKM